MLLLFRDYFEFNLLQLYFNRKLSLNISSNVTITKNNGGGSGSDLASLLLMQSIITLNFGGLLQFLSKTQHFFKF